MEFFDIGWEEFLLIMVIALIVFGPGKMTEIARALGKAVREFRKYTSALTKDFREEFEKEVRATPETQNRKPEKRSNGEQT